MNLPSLFSSADTCLSERAGQLAREQREQQYQKTDRLFAGLLAFEFVAGIAAALWISPFAWAGHERQVHPHVWSAMLLGALIVSLPIWLALVHPGKVLTRQIIGISQLLMSGLLIHLTQGRIETHFHVFGSLAFLAFYRDWRVLITASVVTAVDHLVRGYAWPLSIYGVELQSPWRWLEHAGWVLFEDVFLIFSCQQSNREINTIAERQSQLEATNAAIDREVQQRTAQLRESEMRTRLIVEQAMDAVITINAAGEIVGWNAYAESTFGWPLAEALGRTLTETIIPSQYREAHRRGLNHFLNTGEGPVLNKRIEITASHRDGHEFPVEISICPAKVGGSYLFSAFIRDITERKQADADLRKALEAAKAASKAKSSFLANMSHEIRTPMNGVIGMVQLLAKTELQPRQRDFLASVDESAHVLLRLLNDILDFSKIEAGKLELECVNFRVSECVAQASHLLGLRAAEKGLEIACRFAPEIPNHLRGDPGRLQQVLVNLLSNAVKFTDQGEIFINVNAESITHNQVRLHFSVSDTGIGIPADKQEQIFHSFEQAETSTTRRFGGSGLGLAISAQLVEMMHGRMWVDSEPGRGSTFHFTIEFEIDADQHRYEPAELDSLRDLPVLVVDDNFTNRRILSEILQHWHMQPVLANSAAAARQALQTAKETQHPIRLILLDHHMPGEDGLHFLDSVSSLRRSDQCSVIMISSSSSQFDVERCQAYGIDRFLAKPVIASELLNEVLRQFGKSTTDDSKHPPMAVTASHVQPRRVLLVEDNEINRRVAVGLLRSRGHQVLLAENGQEAVNALAEQKVDVVLMDMQMPVMDGYEATAVIRQREHQTGGHIPIVAMTAEALKGDRERCLAAGMDDYVSKPIAPAEMYRAIERFPALCLPNGSARRNAPNGSVTSMEPSTEPRSPETQSVAPIGDPRPAIDWNVAKSRLAGSPEMLNEFVELVKTEMPAQLVSIRRAIETRDSKLLRRLAHTMKSSVSYFGAEPLIQAALALENNDRAESFEGTPEMLVTLEHEIGRVLAALETGPPESNA